MSETRSVVASLTLLASQAELDVEGLATVGVQLIVDGAWNGTVLFEGSMQTTVAGAVTWFTVPALNITGRTSVTTTVGSGNFQIDVSSFSHFRVRVSVYVAGSAVVVVQGSGAVSPSLVVGGAFPVGALLADGTALPTATEIGAVLLGENPAGTTDIVRVGNTTIDTVMIGLLNTLPQAIYHLTPTVRINGQRGMIEADSAGNARGAEMFMPGAENNVDNVIHGSPSAIASATGAWTRSGGAAAVGTVGINLKASAGRLRSLRDTNSNANNATFLGGLQQSDRAGKRRCCYGDCLRAVVHDCRCRGTRYRVDRLRRDCRLSRHWRVRRVFVNRRVIDTSGSCRRALHS